MKMKSDNLVPHVVMQTWKDGNVPEKWKSSPESIKKHLKSWKYVFMTDKDNELFVSEHFPQLKMWFESLKFPIQRADVIRYLWLYIHGGLYIDMDIELVVSPEELLRDGDLFLLKAPRNFAGHYTNFFMASSKRNPFWMMVIDECLKPLEWWAVLPHHIISQQTGLGAITRAANSYPKTISVLPQDRFVPCDYCNPSQCTKPYSYTRFLKGQSWNGSDTLIINFLGCNPDFVLICIICGIWALWHKKKRARKYSQFLMSS